VQLGERLEVQCHHAALRLFTPADKQNFIPIITPIEDTLRDLSIKFNTLIESAI
jgi:hypothetical protein